MYALHQKRIPGTVQNYPIDDPATKNSQYYSLLRLLPLQRNQYLPSATAGLLSWISATGNLHHIQKKVHQARLKNMLVCCYLGLLFWVHPVGQKYVFFFSFEDGKDRINPCLLNLIFEFFAQPYFLCLLLLQCTRYHYEFNLL